MLLKTKLQIPQVKPNTIIRQRLIALLKDNIDKKLILINAGAGYGKTTLLAQFIAQVEMPNIFYHLEARDSEFSLFLSYLSAGLRNICPRFGRRTRTILKTIAYPDGHTDMIIGTFINEIVENKSDELLIVLDDYHSIDPSCKIDEAINYLLAHAPRNLHLIIATRQKPDLLMTGLKARNELLELTSADLKFNRDEIARLFEEIYDISLEKEELKALEEHSEGWVTSLQLLLQASGSEIKERISNNLPVRRTLDITEWWSDYFNYFAQEIFFQEPPHIQDFMIKSSVLEWLNHGVCNKITGRRNSREILRYLEKRNTFMSRLPDGNYRFHNLFREFLISKWSDMRAKKKTLLEVANHFRESGLTAYAIPHYLEAEHHKQAASLIREVGYDMTNCGKSSTLVSYITQLPMKIMNNDPELLMIYSYAQMFEGYPNEAISTMTRAIRLIKKNRKPLQKLAQAYYELGSIHFNLGNFKKAKHWLTEALEISPAKRTLSSTAMLNSLGLIYSKAGGKRSVDAIECFKKASNIVRRFPENKGLEASIINNWAMAERKGGNLQAAQEKFLTAVDLLKKEENFSPQFGSIFYNAVRLSLYLGNTTEAMTILKLGMELCEKYNDKCSLALIWRGYAIYHEDRGDPDMAIEYLKKAAGVFEALHLNRMISLVNKDLCTIHTAQGQLAEAEYSLTDIWKFKKARDDADVVSIHIIEARLRIAQNKLLNAEHLLTNAIMLAKKFALYYELFLALLEWARLMHIKGRASEESKALRKAVRISDEKSYDYILARFLKEQRWAISNLLKLAKSYTSMILKRWRITYHVVEMYLFGTPYIVVDGKKIKPGAWKTSKALKLFCYLCSHHGRMMSREILIETLWKETSPSSGARNLRKAMHHIRQAFGSVIAHHDKPVMYRNKKYGFAPDFSSWLDIEEFETLLKKAQDPKLQSNVRRENAMRAIDLYQDGFAKGWYDDWVEAMRGFYDRKYEEALTIVIDISFQQKNYRECLLYCQKLLAYNFYNEAHHMRLWSALARLNKHDEIKKDFDELKRMIKKELKTTPRPKTVEYYDTLIR
jgi:LuxR family maltose regulon positive regulatory protein